MQSTFSQQKNITAIYIASNVRLNEPWTNNFVKLTMRVCVYSNSPNDVPRVAQQYGTIAAHTWRSASVLVVFVVFLRAHAQFCRFDKKDATTDVQ